MYLYSARIAELRADVDETLYWASLREEKNRGTQTQATVGFVFHLLFLLDFYHLSKDRFNAATPTLHPEHTSACQLYAHKSPGSQEGGRFTFGLTVAPCLKAFCLSGRPWTEQRYKYLGGCHGKDNDRLMIFFYGGGKENLLHWWPWTTTSLMASKPRCPEVTASNTIWGGERRLITAVINGHMSSNGTWARPSACAGKSGSFLNAPRSLTGAAAGDTAAGHWHYFHNMSQFDRCYDMQVLN